MEIKPNLFSLKDMFTTKASQIYCEKCFNLNGMFEVERLI